LKTLQKEQKFPGLSVNIVSKGDSIFTFDYGYSNVEVGVEHAEGYLGVSSFASMVPNEQFGLIMLCNTFLFK